MSSIIGILLKKDKLGTSSKEARQFFERIRTLQPKLFYKAMIQVTKMKDWCHSGGLQG